MARSTNRDLIMSKLTADMRRIVDEQKLGFVATVNADGTPNLSPKATFVVLDDEHLAFGDLRSPNTVRNLADRAGIEVNFVDPFVRKGFRARGQAVYHGADTPEFRDLVASFAAWGPLTESLRGIVKIHIERAAMVTSPAYDRGADEADLKAQWIAHFDALNKSD